MAPSEALDALASTATSNPFGTVVNEAVGAECVVVTVPVLVAWPPSLSVTVKVMVWLPSVVYEWEAVMPVPLGVPSPQSQEYPVIEPSGSVDEVPSTETLIPFTVLVKLALGSWFAAVTVIGWVTRLVSPESSVTVRVT